MNDDQTSYPLYIERGGELSFLQPYTLNQTQLYGFILEGKLDNLQQLCDKYLNNPARGKVIYKPVTNYIILSFSSIKEIFSQDSPDREKGFFAEHGEVAFWILTMVGKQEGERFIFERFAWFIPYIFVDSPPALISGREIYGFPKEWAWIEIPNNPQTIEHFSLEAVAWETFNKSTEGIIQTLLEIKQIDKKEEKKSFWNELREAFTDIGNFVDFITPSEFNLAVPGVNLPKNIIDYLLHETVPMVFLKQFRDVTDGRKACYQAIVEAPSRLQKFHKGYPLLHDFQINLQNFDSHPFLTDLGLTQKVQIPKLAFWLNFDFSLEIGQEICRTR